MNNDWISLQYLSYALEVEKAGSISKAAENLYMNQPNLSKAIKELETMIGVSLFDRTTKGVSATTKEGYVFLEYARSILAQFKNMKSYFQEISSMQNVFRISSPRASYVAEAFSVFINEIGIKEGFNMVFRETNFLESIRNVTDENFNLAIIRYRSLYENFFRSFLLGKELEYEEILESESVIIVNEKSKLADKTILELDDLVDMIEIVNDDFTTPQQLSVEKSKVDLMPHNKKQILVYERGSQFDLLAHNPNAFMWVSPMPKNVLTRNCLVQKRCAADKIAFKDVLIYRQDRVFGEFEQAFLDNLEKVKESILYCFRN